MSCFIEVLNRHRGEITTRALRVILSKCARGSTLQRQEGLRPRKVEADLRDKVGDLLFTLAACANAAGIDLEESIGKVSCKYDVRDAQDWQKVKTKA